jgi:hypothetical protein
MSFSENDDTDDAGEDAWADEQGRSWNENSCGALFGDGCDACDPFPVPGVELRFRGATSEYEQVIS